MSAVSSASRHNRAAAQPDLRTRLLRRKKGIWQDVDGSHALLKRRPSDIVYRQMLRDAPTAETGPGGHPHDPGGDRRRLAAHANVRAGPLARPRIHFALGAICPLDADCDRMGSPSCSGRRARRATPRPRPARRRPSAAGASVWVAGAVVYAVTWWESVPLPVLTFGAVAAHRCSDIAFRANHRERREVEGGNAPWASFGPYWPSSASLSSSLGFSDGLAMRSTSQPNPSGSGCHLAQAAGHAEVGHVQPDLVGAVAVDLMLDVRPNPSSHSIAEDAPSGNSTACHSS